MKKNKFKVKLRTRIKWGLHKINIFRYIKNYFLCVKYPFLRLRNVWTDTPCGYSSTWYDVIPYGWKKAFGKKFIKELKEALKQEGRLYEFRFHDIKEKYGTLCLYNNGVGKYSDYVISKYEILSQCYCINCGKPVRYVTKGWIEYICEDCKNKRVKSGKYEENYRRLTSDDIPYSIRYEKDKKIKIDYKDTYGIDFYDLWGLE